VHEAEFEHGVELFNNAQFFAAHEVWEDVWRAENSHFRKNFLQGLIQIAVGLHHRSTGNLRGAISLLNRASRNLAWYPAEFDGIQLGSLLQQVQGCLEALARGEAVVLLPRVERGVQPEASGTIGAP
jgi:predicted metal-dependent hydrolase